MLDFQNTNHAPSTPPRPPDPPWADWLDRCASAFDRAAAKEPVSERLAWVAAYLRDAADIAHLHNLQSPGEHTDFLAELRDAEQTLAGANHEPAAPTPRGTDGHDAVWDLTHDNGEDTPW